MCAQTQNHFIMALEKLLILNQKKTNEGEMGNSKRRKCTASNIEEWRNEHFKTSQKPAYNSLEYASSVVFSLWEYFGH